MGAGSKKSNYSPKKAARGKRGEDDMLSANAKPQIFKVVRGRSGNFNENVLFHIFSSLLLFLLSAHIQEEEEEE